VSTQQIHPHNHFDDLQPATIQVSTVGGFPSWLRKQGALERLKLEIEVAVYNWETRKGLPHLDGGFKASIQLGYNMALAKRKRDLRRKVRSAGEQCATNGHIGKAETRTTES
jgi:hypothetical protein